LYAASDDASQNPNKGAAAIAAIHTPRTTVHRIRKATPERDTR
jgi:hypothetical protein